MNRHPRYLGDGVYASFDGYHIWLRTGSHVDADADNRIALDPSVLAALQQYTRDLDRLTSKANDDAAEEEEPR